MFRRCMKEPLSFTQCWVVLFCQDITWKYWIPNAEQFTYLSIPSHTNQETTLIAFCLVTDQLTHVLVTAWNSLCNKGCNYACPDHAMSCRTRGGELASQCVIKQNQKSRNNNMHYIHIYMFQSIL